MNYQGDLNLGDTLDIKFTTVATTGVPTTLAGSPAVAAYVDNGTTEITAGITLTVDFDARTGMHNVRVVASSGNTLSAGTNVNLVLTAGTVSGNSVVGYVVGSFSIEKRSPLRATTAGRTLDVTAGGEAGLDLDNTSGTLAKGTDLTGFNDLSAAQVNTEADTALADVGLTTTVTGRIDAAVSTRATPAQVKTQADAALADAGVSLTVTGRIDASISSRASQASLDALAAVANAIKAIDDKLNTTLELDGAVYRFTINALEQGPTGAGADATAIADAILKRDWTSISGEAAYSLLNAVRLLRNVWNTTGGTLSVKKEDGTTNAWTRPLATDPSAEPIVGAS